MVDEKTIKIGNRTIGPDYPPLVIPEIGINHEGDINKAFKMVDDAFGAGAECVKFQCHIVEDEMIYNDVVPANTDESIWEIMSRCALTEPGEKGNTATGATKPATVETDYVVNVPLFINSGDILKIDTRSGEYIERARS